MITYKLVAINFFISKEKFFLQLELNCLLFHRQSSFKRNIKKIILPNKFFIEDLLV